jgi:hypothetical protein
MQCLLTVWISGVLLSTSPSDLKSKSFCEYGYATATVVNDPQLGTIWEQVWGQQEWGWQDCSAEPNVGFLNSAVTGVLQTRTSGNPVWKGLVVSLPFAGALTLTANENEHGQSAGTIAGTAKGNFVADLNAANAVVTDSTIAIAFGSTLLGDGTPDALIQDIQTSGKFKSIKAQGAWEWRVSGTIGILRVPGLSTQTNIFAALVNSALIIGAEEEIVLSGAYHRESPNE